MISRSRAPWRGIMSQLYVFQAEIISPKQQFGPPPLHLSSHTCHITQLSVYAFRVVFKKFSKFFFFQWGLGTQHPLGPENPLKTIDFICHGVLSPNSHPLPKHASVCIYVQINIAHVYCVHVTFNIWDKAMREYKIHNCHSHEGYLLSHVKFKPYQFMKIIQVLQCECV